MNIDNFLRDITSEQDIISIFGNLEKFQKVETGYKACCPFHNDNNPSFNIGIKGGIIVYHCFGCNESGNLIKYIAKQNNLDTRKDFQKIIEIISKLTNKPIPDNMFKTKEKTKEEIEFETYHKQLLENEQAKDHLKKRGIKDLSIFGYDKDTYKILSKHLDNYYIIDHKPNGEPKYKYPYSFKKDIPFNLHNFYYGDIWVTEGIFDALTLYEHLNLNAIALLGSSLSNNTIEYLERYDNIILCLDNDDAGNLGIIKAIELLYKHKLRNVFYVDYIDFKYKDVNDSIQNNDIESIKKVTSNTKYGYELLIKEHLKELGNTKDHLNHSKILNTFLNNISFYDEYIHNKIINECRKKGYEIEDESKLHKGTILLDNLKKEIENIKGKDIEEIEELNTHINEFLANSKPIEIYNFQDLKNYKYLDNIDSSIIKDIKYYYGAMSFIGARTGQGKTTFMMNEAVNFAISGKKVAFISLEESFEWIGSKLFICYHNKKNLNNKLNLKSYYKAIYENKDVFDNEFKGISENLFIIDKGNNIDDIERDILYLYLHHNISIFFVDYIQRISITNTKQQRQEQIKSINDRLLNLIKKYNIMFISGSQFNRSVTKEDDIKSDSNYREAGDIEQDANLLINLWKEEGKDKDNNDIYLLKYFIAKNRNGKSGLEGTLTAYFENYIIGSYKK